MKSVDRQEKFIELRASGLSYEAISKEICVSKPTLISWSHDFNNEISNLRKVELEAFQEKYIATRKKRIELYGNLINSLKSKIEERGLDSVPTEKLLELLIKYATAIKSEETDFVFKDRFDSLTLDTTRINDWEG